MKIKKCQRYRIGFHGRANFQFNTNKLKIIGILVMTAVALFEADGQNCSELGAIFIHCYTCLIGLDDLCSDVYLFFNVSVKYIKQYNAM